MHKMLNGLSNQSSTCESSTATKDIVHCSIIPQVLEELTFKNWLNVKSRSVWRILAFKFFIGDLNPS